MLVNHSPKLAIAALFSVMLATGCAAGSPDTTSSTNTTESSPSAATTEATSASPNPETAAADKTSTPEAVEVRYFTDNNGVAIRGTDPVAYFNQGGPQAGSADYTHTWRGATWRFASAENRDLFIADPEKYAPQYGGFCAWAVSQGYTASIDPNAWKIVNDRLYLNYSKKVQRTWEKDVPGNISKADNNWPGVLTES